VTNNASFLKDAEAARIALRGSIVVDQTPVDVSYTSTTRVGVPLSLVEPANRSLDPARATVLTRSVLVGNCSAEKVPLDGSNR
jgi:hypothetical protein